MGPDAYTRTVENLETQAAQIIANYINSCNVESFKANQIFNFDSSATIIFDAIKNNNSIKFLDFSYACKFSGVKKSRTISQAFMNSLTQIIEHNKTVNHLALEGYIFSELQLKCLYIAARKNHSITEIVMDEEFVCEGSLNSLNVEHEFALVKKYGENKIIARKIAAYLDDYGNLNKDCCSEILEFIALPKLEKLAPLFKKALELEVNKGKIKSEKLSPLFKKALELEVNKAKVKKAEKPVNKICPNCTIL